MLPAKMRAELFLCATFLLLLPSARSRDTSPFYNALLRSPDLQRRQANSCPADYNSCSMLDYPEACCEPDTLCAMDEAENIACCPTDSACTGVVTIASTNDDTQQQPPPTSTTSGFRPPDQPTPTVTGSTVPDALFPFVYLPTTFRNQEECIQSYSGCQSQFQECTSSLGEVYGVTIGGNGGFGTTVNGVRPTVNAYSACSSLRDEACYGLQAGHCTVYNGGGGGGSSGGAPPARSSALYEIFAGLAIALAGMVT